MHGAVLLQGAQDGKTRDAAAAVSNIRPLLHSGLLLRASPHCPADLCEPPGVPQRIRPTPICAGFSASRVPVEKHA